MGKASYIPFNNYKDGIKKKKKNLNSTKKKKEEMFILVLLGAGSSAVQKFSNSWFPGSTLKVLSEALKVKSGFELGLSSSVTFWAVEHD